MSILSVSTTPSRSKSTWTSVNGRIDQKSTIPGLTPSNRAKNQVRLRDVKGAPVIVGCQKFRSPRLSTRPHAPPLGRGRGDVQNGPQAVRLTRSLGTPRTSGRRGRHALKPTNHRSEDLPPRLTHGITTDASSSSTVGYDPTLSGRSSTDH
jgi:hypothetical protein